MKILHVKYKDGVGGAESVLLMLAAHESARRSKRAGQPESLPPLASYSASAPDDPDALEHHFIINVHGVLTARLLRHTLHTHALRFNTAGALTLRLYAKRQGIDVIHAHGARANLFSTLAAWGLKTPVVTTEHSAGDPWRKRRLMNALDRFAGKRNFCRIAVSEAARQTLLDHRIVPASKIVVIPNGVDTKRFRPGSAPIELVRNLGIEQKQVVTNVGRLAPEKGQEFFIRAAAEVCRQRDDTLFLIVGDGPLGPKLTTLANDLSLGGRLLFLGMRDDVADILRASDVFCLSSLWEGLPVSLLEAMATGRACVSTRVSGVPQILEDGRTGLLAEPSSSASLAEALCELLSNRARTREMGQRGRKVVEERFGVERMIAGYAQAYREAVASAKG